MKELKNTASNKAVLLSPVRANAGTASWYANQLEDLIEAMRRSIEYRLLAAFRGTENRIGFAMDGEGRTTRLKRVLIELGTLWERRFGEIEKTLSRKFAGRVVQNADVAFSAALKKSGFAIEFKPTVASVEAYRTTIAQNVGLIKSIPEEYLKSVEGSVWTAVMKGYDAGALTRELQDKYALSFRRAAFIARDQNSKAHAVMENTRRRELGITDAIWKHSFGGLHPRPSHLAFDGHRFNIAEGALLDNKRVWPGTEPNCRCYSRAIIPAFEK